MGWTNTAWTRTAWTRTGRTRTGRKRARLLLSATAALLLSSLTLAGTANPAHAAQQEGIGHRVTPGQPYGGAPKSGDWVGSYLVGGKQVFCVQFEFKAPDTDEEYRPGDELLTKWGTKLSTETAANISYLLLRYGDTKDADQAAALAHLLHSWTAAPRTDADLDQGRNFREIAYDAPFHLSKLPEGAKKAVDTLTRDAEANRGPWTTSVTPPKEPQTIGSPAEWTVRVQNAKGKGVPDVPVTLKPTQATVGSGEKPDGGDSATPAPSSSSGTSSGPSAAPGDEPSPESGSTIATAPDSSGTATPGTGKPDSTTGQDTVVRTGKDGTATVRLTPTGTDPALETTLSGPADRPYVQAPVDTDTQRVVSTGGEKPLSAKGSVKAVTKPGAVRVTKLDARSGKPIGGVELRLTGKDKQAAATGQDGKARNGEDGKPIVLTTAADGTATVENLRTPQEVCVVEVRAPQGYDQHFDQNSPPSACGTVAEGQTLALELKNTPNEVPRTIPAGTAPIALVHGGTSSGPPFAAVAALGVTALLGSALVGRTARRRSRER